MRKDDCVPVSTGGGGGSEGGGGAVAGAVLDGTVWNDFNRSGLSGWVVELSGDLTKTAQTNASGYYAFVGLPSGTYKVCVVPQSGWSQAWPPMGPSCTTGFGYEFYIEAGPGSVATDNFGYLAQK